MTLFNIPACHIWPKGRRLVFESGHVLCERFLDWKNTEQNGHVDEVAVLFHGVRDLNTPNRQRNLVRRGEEMNDEDPLKGIKIPEYQNIDIELGEQGQAGLDVENNEAAESMYAK